MVREVNDIFNDRKDKLDEKEQEIWWLILKKQDELIRIITKVQNWENINENEFSLFKKLLTEYSLFETEVKEFFKNDIELNFKNNENFDKEKLFYELKNKLLNYLNNKYNNYVK